MNAAQSFGAGITKSLLGILLLVLPAAIVFTFILSRPELVKKVVRDSGTYTLLSETAVETSVTAVQASGQAKGISGEAVTRAAEKAFPASDMQTKGEGVINDSYAWLEGKKKELTLRIDVEPNKRAFAQALADESTNTIMRKPVCSYRQLLNLQTADASTLLQAPCHPQSVDIDVVRQYFASAVGQVSTSVEQTNTPLSKFSQSHNGNTLTTQPDLAAGIPAVFGVLKYAFYLVVGVILLCLLILFLLYRQLANYCRALVAPFVSSGVFLVLYGLAGQWIVQKNLLVSLLPGAQTEVTLRLIKPLALQYLQTSFWCGVGYIVLGIVLYIAYRVLRKTSSVEQNMYKNTDSLQL